MSNLRWIIRDGKEVLQTKQFKPHQDPTQPQAKFDWVDIPVMVEEPPKKSLAQVLYETDGWGGWDVASPSYHIKYRKIAQAAIDYLEKEGWRKP